MSAPIVVGAATLYRGDCLDILRTLAGASIDSVVTDPPYEIGFMGKKWDSLGIAHNVEMWAECLRVLKPGGHLLAFGGTRTQHRMVCAIEDAGFEIRDQIPWLYGSGFPKSRNLDGEWDGWGSSLKPANEPICMARKPLIGTLAENVAAYGTGALNINACRVASINADQNARSRKTIAGKLTENQVYGDGWKGTGRPFDPTSVGRWPANVIHDGSDEVIAAFPSAPGQLARSSSSSRKNQNVYGSLARGSGGIEPRVEIDISAARFFYCAKASRTDRNDGCDALPQKVGGMVSENSGQHITRRDDGYEPKPQGNVHPTVKPTDLMAYLCRLVTPPGGVVLDPFMGSGSTGKAAMREGFQFIGIERDEDDRGRPLEYFDIARARIKFEVDRIEAARAEAAQQPSLFAEVS